MRPVGPSRSAHPTPARRASPRPWLAGAAIAALLFAAVPRVRADAAADLAAARQLQAGAQWAAAESLATAALATLERDPKPDSLAIAEACYLGGVAHMRRSGYADGRVLAAGERALGIRTRRLGASAPAVAEAELLVGRALQGAGQTEAALSHVRRGLEIRVAALAPGDTLTAEAWDQLALVQRDRREFKDAIASWDRAIEVRTLHDGAESPAVAQLRSQTGACWMELGDMRRAREVLEGSLATFARIGQPDHPSRWTALNILADLERREGNLARNVDLLQEALRIVRATFGDDSRQALTLTTNLAAALQLFGDFAGAREQYTALLPRVAAQYGATSPRVLLLRYGLAVTDAALGDTARAIRQFALLDSLFAASAAPPTADAAVATAEYALTLLKQGHYHEALAMCGRADARSLAMRAPPGRYLAQYHSIRVRALIALGDRAALDSARAGLDSLAARYGPALSGVAGEMMYYRALADQALGRRDTAWAEALESERLFHENARTNLHRLSDRTGLQYAQSSLSALDLVLELSREDGSRTEAAWDRLARARGLVRSELARRAVPRGFEADTAVTGAHARWRDAQDRLARALVSGGARDSAARAALDRVHREADETERAYASVLDQRAAGPVPAEHGLGDVRAALRAGEAMVAVAMPHGARDTARVAAFVARAGSPVLVRVELGRVSELRTLIEPWRAALAAPPSGGTDGEARAERECRKLGAKVRARVWEPIAARIGGARQVYLVTDGPLADLPWPALPVEGVAYLIERSPRIHPLDCESDLIESGPAAAAGRLLAIGSPDFDRTGPAEPQGSTAVAALVRSAPDPCLDGRPLELQPLPGSGAEAREVAATWRAAGAGPVTTLVGDAASESAFKTQAAGCAVIHLATHGVMGGDRCVAGGSGSRGMGGYAPLPKSSAQGHAAQLVPATTPVSPWLVRRVWLAFAGANRAGEDATDNDEGLLTAEEVATLDLSGTDWVVLSACHSGSGDAWSSEGRLGMRRAFALAGARSVIASSWALDDTATGEWVRSLYAARLGGETDASAAIRSASLAVLAKRRAAHRPTLPFYWAAFSASGR